MSIPTLVVGLGGTGVLTVRALKRLYHQEPEAELAPASFMAIDFDRSAMEIASDGRFADLDETEFLYLRPSNIQEPLANLDRGIDGELAWKSVHRWFPSRDEVQIPLSEVEANGAGQFRALGRLGLFVHAEQIENALRKGLDSLPCETESMFFTRDRRIMLAASLAGGTGSGMLIDFAYLARRHPSRPRVYAYLLLPEVFAEVDQGGRIYQNAYAALRELAHFKDQQIPFRAEHWQVPPIDIPVGGEEPFTRIFLFDRQICSSDDPVTASCCNAAQAALAQLNKTIQEKTLAIVANTASADVITESRRLRTHCFSSAGSHSMRLGMQEIKQEDILRHVELILKDDERLREVYEPAVDRAVDRARESFGKPEAPEEEAQEPAEGPLEVDADKAAETEQRAQRLSRSFNREIEQTAQDGTTRILEWLKSELDVARQSAMVDHSEVSERAWKAIDNLYEILLQSLEDEKQARKQDDKGPPVPQEQAPEQDSEERSPLGKMLDELRATVPPFKKVEASINKSINNLLHFSREIQNPKDILQRYLFVRELLRFIPFFYLVNFDKEPRNALREQWGRLEKLGRRPEERSRWDKVTAFVRDVFLPSDRKKVISVGRAAVLREAAQLTELADSIKALCLARAAAELRGRLGSELWRLHQRLERLRQAWSVTVISSDELSGDKLQPLPAQLKARLEGLLQDRLPRLLAEAQEKIRPEDDDERKRIVLRRILQKQILSDERLRAARFILEEDDGSAERAKKRIIANFVAARQELFVRRTPNPQRKGFAIILTPEGIVWPDGQRRFKRFLDSSAEQILECRSQTMTYRGERLWFYYEDLFNPPEHIRNLDDYYHSYKTQAHPELFHIDRRLLQKENFRHIYAGSHRLVVSCGNEDCSANIAYEDRALQVCPECHRKIRSRCGNPACRLDELHSHPRGHDKTCPGCGGFNGAAWWRCDRHGKQEVLVAADKPRCPECVLNHHDDPVAYPESKIGRRPDTVEVIDCPHCLTILDSDPDYKPFRIRLDLLPYYRHGVNGHDRDSFLRLARGRYKLADDFRCPQCRTALIPYHHGELKSRELKSEGLRPS